MTTLRERSHLILWTLLFFFVASLVLGGLMSGSNILGVLFGTKDLQNYVGTIDGNRITIREYEYQRSIELNRIARNGGEDYTLTEKDIVTAGNDAWNTLIDDYIKKDKIESLGLVTHGDEVREFLLLSPPDAFKKNLMDAGLFKQEDGEFDLLGYQDAIKNNALPYEMKDLNILWETYIKDWLSDRKLRDLYGKIKTIPDYEVMDKYLKDSIDVSIDYVYISPNKIPDSLFNVSDEALMENYNKNKNEKYKLDESVTVNYVLFTTDVEPGDTIDYEFEQNELYNDAFQFSVEANEYTSFNEAIKMYKESIEDTLTLTQILSSKGDLATREVIRFAFDNNIDDVSDPIEVKDGIAIFNIISKNQESFKSFDEVKEQIEKDVMKDLKADKAKTILSDSIDRYSDWNKLSEENDLISLQTNQNGKISSNFADIGSSSELTAALIVLDVDQISTTIETRNYISAIKVLSKSEFNNDDYQEKYADIKTSLQTRNSFDPIGKNVVDADYFNWINSRRNEIEIEDWRHLIY